MPFWSNSLSGLAGAESGAAAATALAAGRTEKSPALATPDCLTLATQCANTGNSCPVWSRLNWKSWPCV